MILVVSLSETSDFSRTTIIKLFTNQSEVSALPAECIYVASFLRQFIFQVIHRNVDKNIEWDRIRFLRLTVNYKMEAKN